MELRPDSSHKENVPPGPATPLRPGKRFSGSGSEVAGAGSPLGVGLEPLSLTGQPRASLILEIHCAGPPGPERRRLLKSLGVGLGSGRGWWVPMGQVERGEPATRDCTGALLHQEPCRVQTNLASLRPGGGLALKNTTGRLMNSSFRQQCNLRPPGGLPQRRARESALQQSNLSVREISSVECGSRTSPHLQLEPQESFWPHKMPRGSPLPPGPLVHPSSGLRESWLLATHTRCWDVRPTLSCALLDGHTWPGPGCQCDLGNWSSRFMGEPLTLEDLAAPAQSQAWAPSQAAISQLLASVQCLEQEAARLGCRASQKPPGPSQEEPWTSDGQALPAYPQPSQPVLASWDERKQHPWGLRGTGGFPEMPGAQADLSDSEAGSKPRSLETTVEMLTGDFLDPEQGVLSAHPPRRGGNCFPGPTYSRGQRGDPLLPQGVGSREARLCSSTFSRAAQGILSGGKGGEKALWEQVTSEEERTTSCSPDTAPARAALQNKARNVVSLESEVARRQLLSRCFRAWGHSVWRRQAMAAAVALGRRQLLRRCLQTLRWRLWLREAQLEVAWRRHMQALLARSFLKWRNLTQQQKQRQPHIQAGAEPVPSGGDQGQGSSGRKPVVDPTQRTSPGSMREEARAPPSPSSSGWRPDGGDGRVQIQQALQQLAVLLRCHQKDRARQERGVQGEASQARLSSQRMGMHPQAWCSPAADAAWVAPLDPQHQRAWVCSSFFQGAQGQMLRRILGVWRLRVWGPGTPSGNTRTTSAPEPLDSVPGGEASLGCGTPHSSLRKASRAPGLLETLQLSFLQAAGQRQQGRCLLLWQARAQQSRGATKWHERTLQRRILLGWSHWAVAQVAQTELAAHWAWDQSCKAMLGCWRQWLEQWQEAEQWTRERGQRRLHDALRHWSACWQRQQFLHGQYQTWVQGHLQGLQRVVSLGWQQAATCRRHTVASHVQAQCEPVRDAGMLWTQCQALQDGLRRQTPGAAFTMWQEGGVATARAREQRLARASIVRWRSHVQEGQADRQLRARAQQAFAAWRVALGQLCEARQQAEERARAQAQVALYWTLWVCEFCRHRLSQAHAARKLSARVLEAWAQSAAQRRVRRATITQFQQAGLRRLLQTHWAQWRTALLRLWLESGVEAQEASTAHPRPRAPLWHRPRLASRGCLLVIRDTAAPWKQTHSYWPQATRPVLPGPTQHHGLGGWKMWKETSWAQRDRGDCSSGTSTIKGKGWVDKRWLGRKYLQRWHLQALLCRLQGSQQARRLVATWQRWVDAQGAEELACTLLRQWHLRWARPTWWQRLVRLRVARRLRQQGGWVVSQAFEKWHQSLAARGQRRGATSSLRPPEQRGHQELWEHAGSWRSPCEWTRGGPGGPAAAVTCSHGKVNGTEPSLPQEGPVPRRPASAGCQATGRSPTAW